VGPAPAILLALLAAGPRRRTPCPRQRCCRPLPPRRTPSGTKRVRSRTPLLPTFATRGRGRSSSQLPRRKGLRAFTHLSSLSSGMSRSSSDMNQNPRLTATVVIRSSHEQSLEAYAAAAPSRTPSSSPVINASSLKARSAPHLSPRSAPLGAGAGAGVHAGCISPGKPGKPCATVQVNLGDCATSVRPRVACRPSAGPRRARAARRRPGRHTCRGLRRHSSVSRSSPPGARASHLLLMRIQAPCAVRVAHALGTGVAECGHLVARRLHEIAHHLHRAADALAHLHRISQGKCP